MSAPPTAPAIDTARLTLRGHTLADLDDVVALWADPEVVRFIGGRPFTPEETWAKLQRNVGHWALMGHGYWVVRDRESGRFVGEVGLAEMRRTMTPALDAPEAGWVLAPWAHGRGLATEAMTAVLAWAETRFGAGARSVCIIDEDHAASVRVAAKLGYRELGVRDYRGTPVRVLARP